MTIAAHPLQYMSKAPGALFDRPFVPNLCFNCGNGFANECFFSIACKKSKLDVHKYFDPLRNCTQQDYRDVFKFSFKFDGD